MSGSINIPTPPAPYVDALGIHAPAFSDYLTYLTTCFQIIYGADIYLGNDSQDGQLINVFAAVLADQAAACVAAYNSYSPSTAQGVGLSSVIKINNMQRNSATYSQVQLQIIGTAFLPLNNALASDGTYNWSIPSGSQIPAGGLLLVTATCTTIGAINAQIGTITTIKTPTAGWQSVTNLVAATPGAPVESDPQLRIRQNLSTMKPSLTVIDGIVASILALSGVTSCVPYVNDTDTTNTIGIPANAMSLVIAGAPSLTAVAAVIFTQKTPGSPTYGNTSANFIDAFGINHVVNWYTAVQVPITLAINVTPLTGYLDTTAAEIAASVAAYINALGTGQNVLLPRVSVPAQLMGPYASYSTPNDPNTFELASVLMSRSGPPTAADIPIAFYEYPSCVVSAITVTAL